MHPDTTPQKSDRPIWFAVSIKTLLAIVIPFAILLAAAVFASRMPRQSTPAIVQPAPAVVIATPAPIQSAADAENAYALAYFDARESLDSISNVHNNLYWLLKENNALIDDAAWRASVDAELALFRRSADDLEILQPPANFVPANDALWTAAAAYAAIIPSIEESLANSNAQLFLDTYESMQQARRQLSVSTTLFLAER